MLFVENNYWFGIKYFMKNSKLYLDMRILQG